jgi:pimeloyl-ACP methyl ester carboxylesterase
MNVKRAFADIAEGQMHYRFAGWDHDASPPLVMFHGSPGSSWALERLVGVLGETRTTLAFDTLGQGDSSRPATDDADMAYFADAAGRALEALGPRFSQFDVFGTHTGARIATELAIGGDDRVRKLILDGMSDGINPFYRQYAETLDKSHLIDQEGTQFFKTWTIVRDGHIFWPPSERNAEHLRGTGLPTADTLHDQVMDALKSVRAGHVAYRAAILYPSDERLPLVKVPTLVTCATDDSPFQYFDGAAKLVPGCSKKLHPHANPITKATDEELGALAEMLQAWLDG